MNLQVPALIGHVRDPAAVRGHTRSILPEFVLEQNRFFPIARDRDAGELPPVRRYIDKGSIRKPILRMDRRIGCKERLVLPAAYGFAVDAKASLPCGVEHELLPVG